MIPNPRDPANPSASGCVAKISTENCRRGKPRRGLHRERMYTIIVGRFSALSPVFGCRISETTAGFIARTLNPEHSGMLAIRCNNLTKRYDAKPPVDAVRGLDLAVEQGECFGLLGPNGAGKTTTIEILEGLLEATSGEVEVLGFHWGRQRRRNSPADRHLAARDSACREAFGARNAHAVPQFLPPRNSSPTKRWPVCRSRRKPTPGCVTYPAAKNNGWPSACALVGDPELLFLDEPTTGLDPQSRRQLWDIIRHFRDAGRTVLITTHYMDEAERLCDRMAIVDHGKVIALGTPRELIASLGGEHVIEFTLETTGGDGSILAERFADLPTVSAARRERPHQPFGRRTAHRPAGAVGTAGIARLPAHGVNHAECQLGRRVCETRRPAFVGSGRVPAK